MAAYITSFVLVLGGSICNPLYIHVARATRIKGRPPPPVATSRNPPVLVTTGGGRLPLIHVARATRIYKGLQMDPPKTRTKQVIYAAHWPGHPAPPWIYLVGSGIDVAFGSRHPVQVYILCLQKRPRHEMLDGWKHVILNLMCFVAGEF